MDLPDLIRKLAQTSRTLPKEEVAQCQMLTEVCKALLRLEATRVLQENPLSINLMQYSADCTPLKVRTQYSVHAPSGKTRASAKETAEYLVQQIFMTTAIGRQPWEDRLIFREPMPLQFGKTMPALAACMQSFLKGTWCLGTSQGITIHHQVHDRGMSRTFRDAVAGHLAKLVSQDHVLGDAEATHEALHIFTEASCSLHDSHNAFKWGFQAVYGDRLDQILADLYMGISCYRSAVGKCLPFICSWLDEALTPTQAADLPLEDELSHLYSAIGVPADVLDVLCTEMRLMWQPCDKKLLVLDTFLQKENAVEVLSSTLLTLWKFPAFCASRWTDGGHLMQDFGPRLAHRLRWLL